MCLWWLCWESVDWKCLKEFLSALFCSINLCGHLVTITYCNTSSVACPKIKTCDVPSLGLLFMFFCYLHGFLWFFMNFNIVLSSSAYVIGMDCFEYVNSFGFGNVSDINSSSIWTQFFLFLVLTCCLSLMLCMISTLEVLHITNYRYFFQDIFVAVLNGNNLSFSTISLSMCKTTAEMVHIFIL